MEFVTLDLKGDLSDDLIMVFHLKNYHPEHPIERLIPDGSASLVIELDDQERFIYDNESLAKVQLCRGSWLSGNFTEYLSFGTIRNTDLMGVRFKPGGLYPYIDLPMDNMKNRVLDGVEVFGRDIEELRMALIREKESIEKNKILGEWLIDLKSKYNKPVNERIKWARDEILNFPNFMEINKIVSRTGYSDKHFISLFKNQIGFTPKIFQRIIKFNQILPKIQQSESLSWTQISHECGYYDQSHFIRDFKKFSGFNPSEFIEMDFERNNFFPMGD